MLPYKIWNSSRTTCYNLICFCCWIHLQGRRKCPTIKSKKARFVNSYIRILRKDTQMRISRHYEKSQRQLMTRPAKQPLCPLCAKKSSKEVSSVAREEIFGPRLLPALIWILLLLSFLGDIFYQQLLPSSLLHSNIFEPSPFFLTLQLCCLQYTILLHIS